MGIYGDQEAFRDPRGALRETLTRKNAYDSLESNRFNPYLNLRLSLRKRLIV